MRILVVTAAALMACDAGAPPPSHSPAPLKESVAPAPPIVSLPPGWVTIVPTDEQRQCANRADDEWEVAIDSHGSVVVTKATQREPDTGPALPFEPKGPPEFRGRRHTLAFGNGYLVGFDAGEWGGSLSWFAKDGSGQESLGKSNVHGLVALGPKLAVSLEGLAHLSINEGVVRWIDLGGGKSSATKTTPLPDEPEAFASAADGSVYVLTWTSLVKITSDRRVRVVQPLRTEALYAGSMAIDTSGVLWIGMRQFVVRLTPDGDRFRETWLVRENCQRMQTVDLTCVCR